MAINLSVLASYLSSDLENDSELTAYTNSGKNKFSNLFVEPRILAGQGSLTSVNELIQSNKRAIIVGEPGTGKTTLLRYLTLQFSKSCLNNDNVTPCPFFLRAYSFDDSSESKWIFCELANQIERYLSIQVTQKEINRLLEDCKIQLLIDGLDEVLHSERRMTFYSQINDFARQYPNIRVILSSRPAALSIPFSEFSYYYIEGITRGQILKFIQKRSNENNNLAERFVEAIWSNRKLATLAQSPLFLNVLWGLYQYRSTLPTNISALYADCVDFLLSTWEQHKSIRRNFLSVKEKQVLLEQLSFQLLLDDRNSFTRTELEKTIEPFKSEHPNQDLLADELLTSGLLVQHDHDNISFIHRSFLEYFSAHVISKDPSKIPLLVSKRHLHDVVVMACGLLVDIAPIIETAVTHQEVMLAAKCVSQARTKNPRLTQFVYQVLLNELGTEFLSELEGFHSKSENISNGPDIYDELLLLWDKCFEKGLDSHLKGKRFEDFSVKLFNTFSKVVRHDLHTENGELDLICENIISTPFWQDYGGEFPVECKNWSSKIPIHEVGHFAHKMEMTKDVRLAFFISVNGFTEDALRTLRNQAARGFGPLIVPISGSDIKEAILKRDKFEDFFKEAIRDIKYLRKF